MKRVFETSKRKLSFTENTPSFYGFTLKQGTLSPPVE